MASLPVLVAISGVLTVKVFQRRENVWLSGTLVAGRAAAQPVSVMKVGRRTAPGHAIQVAYRGARNILDRAIALLALVLLSPLLGLIAVAIRLDSPGPIFFRQRRVGRDGSTFTIVKFRTLHMHAPAFSLKLSDRDHRITRVGRFLRRSGLDESPQLWNVLTGEMALIGPRPEQADLIDLYEPWQRMREQVRPGITGWWQVRHRDGVPLHQNVEEDLYYIEHQGPWLDLLIVVATVRILLTVLLSGGMALSASSKNPVLDPLVDETSGA